MQAKLLTTGVIVAGSLFLAGGLAGCETSAQPTTRTVPVRASGAGTAPATDAALRSGQGTQSGEAAEPQGAILAYINGQPIRAGELQGLLLEAAGGGVLGELVVDRMLARELEQRRVTISEQDIQAERRLLVEHMHDEPGQAERLLRDLRQQRGLGDQRFNRLLRRNAGLRKLVVDQVDVSDELVGQEFQMMYGPRYQARLIVTQTQSQAATIVRRVRQGESFIDLAVEHSIDPSSAQGGLMPAVSAADPTWPVAIRTALERMEPGALSTPIAIEDGFAVLLLQRKIPGETVQFEDVKDAMALRARRRLEQLEMQRLVQAFLNQADVVILEPGLQRSWRQRN